MVKKTKISELPVAETLIGLSTIGVDEGNNSVQVSLEFVAVAADQAQENALKADIAAQEATTAGHNANTQAEYAKEQADYAKEQADYAKQQADSLPEQLVSKADETSVATRLATKADETSVATRLATKADETSVATRLATKADLSDGKVRPDQLPALAITDTFAVHSEQSMLYLEAQKGDLCVRIDLSKTFILATEPATEITHWVEMLSPSGSVSSVNGQIGAVTIDQSTVGLGAVNNTADSEKTVANSATLEGKHASDFAPSGYGLGSQAQRVTGDWNDVVQGGWYDGKDLVNSPVAGWVNMMVSPAQDPAYLTQIAFDMIGDWRWIRNKRDNIWGEWQQLATMNLVLPKSGGVIDGNIQMSNPYASINSRHFEGTVENEGGELFLNFHNNKSVIFGPSKAIFNGATGTFTAFEFITTSDERKKTDITSFESETLNKSLEVKSVSFRWRDGDDRIQSGAIAQEVEKLLPELVHTDEQGYKSVSYTGLHSIQIQALIEQNRILQERLATLEQTQNKTPK